MFSPQSSVIVSLLSGAGLVAIVSLAPVRQFDGVDAPSPWIRSSQPKSDTPLFHDSLDSDNPRQYGNTDSVHPNPNEFSLRAPISEELLDKNNKWENSGLVAESESLSSSIRNRTDWDLYSNRVGERKVFFQKDGLVMRGFSSSSAQNWTPFRRDSYLADRYGFRRNDSYEIQYSITSNIGAVVQGGAYDHFDDRSREQRNVAMAGVSVKTGDFFSARMLTGDSNYAVNTPVSSFNYNPLSPNRPNDISRRERDDIKQVYEWQANFTPSDYFKLQTSVYNQRAENSVNLSSPDGGKVSLFAGNQRIQMNVRYNYLNSRNNSNGILTGQSFSPSQDLASLGVILFLDPSQRYSIYLGNNFYNVLNDPLNQVKDASGKSPTTFTASFRGKNPNASRSSFFFNVQNQFYKDGTMLGAPGMMQLGGLQGKSFYEYATSLGLEVAF
ncbi:hypothetical protein [Leptospira kobayashii]|uniref:hypothetical protein n=1 Tax=Leptospira kobayashii TaxID=1917830 RepID=UPI000D59CAFA|nr:hypothetical protein [Leptospira kobayashii]